MSEPFGVDLDVLEGTWKGETKTATATAAHFAPPVDAEVVDDDANDFAKDKSPETALTTKAFKFFGDKIVLASGIKRRAEELGLEGAVTIDNYDQAKIITGMCKTARGGIERNRKIANEDALAWQRAINARAKELVAEVYAVDAPYRNGIKAIDDAREQIKRDFEEAKRRAEEAAEKARRDAEQAEIDAKHRAEAEANRIEAERLAKERAAMDAERKVAEEKLAAERRAAEKAMAAERCKIDEANRIERERLTAEMNERLVKERAVQAEKDRIAASLRESERNEREKIQRELAEFKAAKEAKEWAEREAKEAAERAEREKREAAEREAARVKAEAEELARRERLKPESEKMKDFADRIILLALESPVITQPELVGTMSMSVKGLKSVADALTAAAK